MVSVLRLILPILSALLFATGCAQDDGPPVFDGPDLLDTIGARATEGATAGYVADNVCATCHADLYESYQHVGMAQSR